MPRGIPPYGSVLWFAFSLLLSFSIVAADPPAKDAKNPTLSAAEEHARLFAETKYPSATTCKVCHPDHYREWSVSPHSYAQLSPVFNAMQGIIIFANNGTMGDFCIRCHNQVGMNLKEPVFIPNADRHPTSREGITCVVCHRLENAYGKNSGRFALIEGDLFKTIYGPNGDEELKRVLGEPDKYRVSTNSTTPGRQIHTDIERSPQLTQSDFCGSCHEVLLMNGFRLEETLSSFKTSPAHGQGYNCADCHMGKEPGKPSGFDTAPAAIVGGVPTKPRKRTNHMFIGPDYSIVHPGIFPHNDKAAQLATLREWLTFDHKAGWGKDSFEKTAPKDYKFPERWASADDRYDAREILNDQFKLLGEASVERVKLLREGYKLGDMEIERADEGGVKFKIQVKSNTGGHSIPTGFDVERLVFLQITVTNSAGKVVFKSGDLDPNGDVRDRLSTYVKNGELPIDKHLFNLQANFVTLNARGGDREQVGAENFSFDPLPFVRPESFSTTLSGRPGGARVQRHSLEPYGQRWGNYRIKKSELTGPGPYKVNVRFLAAMVPVNLISVIRLVGFDYGMSPREVADAVRNGHVVLYDKTVTLDLDGKKKTIDLAAEPDNPIPNPYAY